MWKALALLLVLTAAPALAGPPTLPSAGETPVFVTYTHAWEPAFSVTIPASHFYAQPEPPAHAGATFTALDGQAEIRVWANFNVLEQDLAGLLQEALAGHAADKVTYRKEGDGWFVLSGYSGQAIFYERAIVDERAIYQLQLRYPMAQRAVYDDLVTQVVKSFRSGD